MLACSVNAPDLVVHQMEEAGVQKLYTFVKELGGGSFGVVWLVRGVFVLQDRSAGRTFEPRFCDRRWP